MAEYDSIAREYQKSKLLPFRQAVEVYNLFSWLGDLSGKAVLDLACGEGFHLREIKRRGAAAGVGVDLSEKMIELALAHEENEPLGLLYHCHDVATMPTLGEFDVIVACFLLNYAQTREQLLAFLSAMARNLKPGGRVVVFNDNPGNDPAYYASYARYGFTKESVLPRQEGDTIVYRLQNADGSIAQFNNYYLSPSTYEACFRAAGFKEARWLTPAIDPHFLDADPEHWRLFIEEPPFIGVELR